MRKKRMATMRRTTLFALLSALSAAAFIVVVAWYLESYQGTPGSMMRQMMGGQATVHGAAGAMGGGMMGQT